jgi:hypothetical protein
MDHIVQGVPFCGGEIKNGFAMRAGNDQARSDQNSVLALQKHAKIIFDDDFVSFEQAIAERAITHFYFSLKSRDRIRALESPWRTKYNL